MIIDIEIHDTQAEALAQVLKRIGFSEIRKLCADDNEAYDAQYALEKIRESLAESGYNPR
jgi:hypothetical protein